MVVLIMAMGVALLVMATVMLYTYLITIPRYESHWKATEHELNTLWAHVNTIETGIPEGADLPKDLYL